MPELTRGRTRSDEKSGLTIVGEEIQSRKYMFVLEFDGGWSPSGSGCGSMLYEYHASEERLELWRAWCHLATTPINANVTEYEGLSCGLWYFESELERSSISGEGGGSSSGEAEAAAPTAVLEVRGENSYGFTLYPKERRAPRSFGYFGYN